MLHPKKSSKPPASQEEDTVVSSLAVRERYRDEYWRKHDPIVDDRLLWRAQTFRHTVHLLPGQTILELGCGELRLTRVLLRVSRGENPITAVTFQNTLPAASDLNGRVEVLQMSELPGQLARRRFDCIVAMDLLDRSNSSELLSIVHELLAPGGEMVFYESNPWNPVHKLRAMFLRLAEKKIRETFLIDQVFTSYFPNSGSFESMPFSMILFSPRLPGV